jgi:hypothetical protein
MEVLRMALRKSKNRSQNRKLYCAQGLQAWPGCAWRPALLVGLAYCQPLGTPASTSGFSKDLIFLISRR